MVLMIVEMCMFCVSGATTTAGALSIHGRAAAAGALVAGALGNHGYTSIHGCGVVMAVSHRCD